MGDVAQILGFDKQSESQKTVASVLGKNHQPSSSSAAASGAASGGAASNNPSKSLKISGVSREVLDLLGGKQDQSSVTLPPIVPSFLKGSATASSNKNNDPNAPKDTQVKVGSKWISSSKSARKWTWAPFASSSRTDGAMFRHWVRANVEYTDYPYAKFDIHLDPVAYTDEEYNHLLKSDSWTKSETDKLMEIVRKYELRWPIILDRWFGYYQTQANEKAASRKIEDLQYRYYSVAAILAQSRISQEAAAEVQNLTASMTNTPVTEEQKESVEALLMETAAARLLASTEPRNQPLMINIGTGTSNKTFDYTHEKDRRAHLERLWERKKEEEIEEIELRKELKLVEAQLRKLKKSGGHILAAANGAPVGAIPVKIAAASSARGSSKSSSTAPGFNIAEAPAALLDQCFASTAPTPMAQTPYLQSGRLVPPATGGLAGMNRTLLNRMDAVLAEFKIPPRPLPTKRVCDLYDSVRKDILKLLTLQKTVLQKEGTLQARRLKLAKMGGGDKVLDEEVLLGLSTPTAPKPPGGTPPPVAAAAAVATTTTSATTSTAPATTSRGKTARQGKTKSTSTTGGKTKSSTAKSKAAAAATADGTAKPDAKDTTTSGTTTKKTKTTTKRKRKSEAKSAAAAAAAAASTTAAAAVPLAVPPTTPSESPSAAMPTTTTTPSVAATSVIPPAAAAAAVPTATTAPVAPNPTTASATTTTDSATSAEAVSSEGKVVAAAAGSKKRARKS